MSHMPNGLPATGTTGDATSAILVSCRTPVSFQNKDTTESESAAPTFITSHPPALVAHSPADVALHPTPSTLSLTSVAHSEEPSPLRSSLAPAASSSSSSSACNPCGACKFLRRKCTVACAFAPHFLPDQSQRFANVHKVFGASNISKWLQDLPVQCREDAVSSLCYEADARIKDPVYGCVGALFALQQQVERLQTQTGAAEAELARLRALAAAQASSGALAFAPASTVPAGLSGGPLVPSLYPVASLTSPASTLIGAFSSLAANRQHTSSAVPTLGGQMRPAQDPAVSLPQMYTPQPSLFPASASGAATLPFRSPILGSQGVAPATPCGNASNHAAPLQALPISWSADGAVHPAQAPGGNCLHGNKRLKSAYGSSSSLAQMEPPLPIHLQSLAESLLLQCPLQEQGFAPVQELGFTAPGMSQGGQSFTQCFAMSSQLQ